MVISKRKMQRLEKHMLFQNMKKEKDQRWITHAFSHPYHIEQIVTKKQEDIEKRDE